MHGLIFDLAIVSWMATQLVKQKKTDFKPRNDDDSFARVNTDPCIGCCEILEKVGTVAKKNLSGKNLEIFLTEVGVAFHRYGFCCARFCSISSHFGHVVNCLNIFANSP
jgi:Exocyst complex component Sec10